MSIDTFLKEVDYGYGVFFVGDPMFGVTLCFLIFFCFSVIKVLQ